VRLHPVLWVAAVSVIVFSAVGIAKFAGVLPEKQPEIKESLVSSTTAPEQKPLAAVETNQPNLPVAHSASAPLKIAKKHVQPVPNTEQPPTLPPPLNSGIPPDYVTQPTVSPAVPACPNCGVVESISEVSRELPGSGAGAVMGSIAGGVLGSNVGKGSGRALATMAGIFGGAIIGDGVERSQHRSISYKVIVKMDDGDFRTVEIEDVSSLQVGDHIRLSGGRLSPR
jgi:hypothetical protein